MSSANYNNKSAEILITHLQENLIYKFLVYYPVRFGAGVFPPPAVESRVQRVEGWRQGAADVEPPVTGGHALREDCSVGTQERGLAPVDVAVVPCWKLTRFKLVQ